MLGISTCWWYDKVARGEEIVNDVLELGLEGVELEYRISAAMYQGMKTRLKEALTVLSIHNYFPKPEEVGDAKGSGDLFLLSSSDREERLRAVKYSIRTIEHASDLGARAVVLHLGRVDIPADDVLRVSEAYKTLTDDPQEGRRLIDRQMRERAKRKKKNLDAVLFSLEALNREAERRGVYLGVENRVHYFEIPDFEEIGLILDRFGGGRVRYWHDVGHAHIQEKLGLIRQKELLEAYGDRLVGVHLHDVTGINDHLAPGQGELNFEQIKPFLKPSHIKILEVHPKVDRDGLREGIRFVTSMGI